MSYVKLFAICLGTLLIAIPALGQGSDCTQKCKETYPPHTTEINEAEVSCEKGCRLFSLIEGVTKTFDQTDNDTLKNCKHSCDDAYEKSKDKSTAQACQAGCEFQKPNIVETKETDQIQEIGMPFFTIQLPNMFDDMEDLEFPKWANDMRKSMDAMHQRMMTWVKNSFPDKQFFGADLKHDMMTKKNPLDEFFDSSNFEMLDSKEQKVESGEFPSGGNRVFEIEIIGPYKINSANINGFEIQDELEPPRLPEEGLKTRLDAEMIYMDHICKRNSKDMSWSDVFSCLHHRMRVPRWLSIASISLCIIFIIWLCLIIPQNAPKQKVKKEKDLSAKEKEALSIVSMHLAHATSVPNDLPPSYEEIANLQVQLVPMHQTPLDEKPKSTKI